MSDSARADALLANLPRTGRGRLKVFLGAAKAADGSLTATRLLVGKDGLTPPM